MDEGTLNGGKTGQATLQDIADSLNLSVATVSRALRKIPGINPDTRSRVMSKAAQLGYRTPQSYRNDTAKTAQLQHIAVLINTPFTQINAPYLTGLADAAMSSNASLMVHYVRPETCENILVPRFQPPAWRSGLLSGLVLVFRWPDHVVQKLSHLMPTVSIIHKYHGVEVDWQNDGRGAGAVGRVDVC